MGDVRQEIALYNKSTIEILYRIILGGGITVSYTHLKVN